MIIADKLRNTNRAEYLLYLWYVEDLLRAFGCDAARVEKEYLIRFRVDEARRAAMLRWYTDLCEMMHAEGCTEGGHLQITKNAEQELAELHARLLASPLPADYAGLYRRALPTLVELRQRNGKDNEPELRTMLTALYGVMVLGMKGSEVSPATRKAIEPVSELLRRLSDYYFQDKEKPLEL